jgi:predicted AlkP superfamily phosphohydrolase/phosphomutase
MTLANRNPNRGKVVVLGLDGVPYSLLVEYMERGIMPEFSRLCGASRQLVRMNSSLPEVSSVAWTSFMTGRNPGEHGVFGFMEIDRETYAYKFPSFRTLKARPFWEVKNIKTVALNIPQTCPALPMNGVMVSGFVALDLKKATYPEKLLSYLNSIGYRLDVNARLASRNPEAFFDDLFVTFGKRKEATEHLYSHEEWQLFITTITETDRLHHFFFDSARDGQYFPVFEKFYRQLDSFIGSLANRAMRDGAAFITCSDHGFTPIKTEVNINRWLAENAYLELRGSEGLRGITVNSRAFCLDPSRIYIHLKGKFARGSVEQADYVKLRDELRQKLRDLVFDGQQVVKEIFVKEDIFKGPLKDEGPDLYVLPNYGFDLKGAVDKETIFETTAFRGMHTFDDAHLFVAGTEAIANPEIGDVAEIILKALGK